jgi:Protein of unknown function (DUF1360)
MNQIYDTIIDAVAVHRITRLIVEDEITSDLRSRWYEKHDPQETKLGYLVSCPWCVSIWAGAAAVAARRVAPGAWSPLAHTLAFSAVAGALHGRI